MEQSFSAIFNKVIISFGDGFINPNPLLAIPGLTNWYYFNHDRFVWF